MCPLREALFPVCGTVASGDDYDIVDWGNVMQLISACAGMR